MNFSHDFHHSKLRHWTTSMFVTSHDDHGRLILTCTASFAEGLQFSYMVVSRNSGTPKSSVLIGFVTINQPCLDTPIYGNPYIIVYSSLTPFFFAICCFLDNATSNTLRFHYPPTGCVSRMGWRGFKPFKTVDRCGCNMRIQFFPLFCPPDVLSGNTNLC